MKARLRVKFIFDEETVEATVIDKIIVGYPAYSRTEYVIAWIDHNGINHCQIINPKADKYTIIFNHNDL